MRPEHWTGFLPRRAIVMARLAEGSTIAADAATATASGTSDDSLDQIALDLRSGPRGCERCKLCNLGRRTIVVGEGNPRSQLVFVGEGPGEQEDIQGRPFVGKAGQLLDRMIEAIGLKRADVYIANVVKCRPPGNRNPEPDEIAACSPFLMRQLDLLRPRVIVSLGKFSAQTLLQTSDGIMRLRGRFYDFHRPDWSARLMPTFHPAYLLRNPDGKREAWADLQQVARELGIAIPPRAGRLPTSTPSARSAGSELSLRGGDLAT